MNPKINYTLVGAFVVLLTVLGLAFISWMSHDSSGLKRLPYIAYFGDSVSGLNERAAVKYKGVPVGYVESIKLITSPEEKVELKLRLDADLQLKSSTYASLQFQGITGLLFVELQNNAQNGTFLVTSEENPAVIASQSSRLGQMTENLDLTLQNFSELAVSLNQLTQQLTDFTSPPFKNQVQNVLSSIENLGQITSEKMHSLDLNGLQKVLEQLGQQGQDLQSSLNTELKSLSQELQQLSQDGQASARQLMPLLLEAQNLAQQLLQEGNSWLRGNQRQAKGPGED